MIEASVVCDSVSPAGKRITTFKLRYPKMIHGELMTHRVISRNASSSRAIPIAKMIAEVRDDATRAAPVFWGAEQKGMQAVEELTGYALDETKAWWKQAAINAANIAEAMAKHGAHKQVVNRILEPFSHINVVATATEWDNFFGLRLDAGAMPEMRALAVAMWESRKASTPRPLASGQWHLPFVDGSDQDEIDYRDGFERSNEDFIGLLVKISVARCARVSYESFETGRRSTVEEDLRLYERLVGSQPLHASPAEHQATPIDLGARMHDSGQQGNFIGWRQYRKMLSGEAVAPLPAEYRA